ncbi:MULTISPECIES: hypothetical protein [Flavobacterium]|uniref:Uncharacterized protein n=1 Tax=Flavobacterium ranwuense TaxID=2541725 RepID=A0ABY2DPK0_9FLAO|nr:MULTISPECIES: hypothetical protein [Flavobacterium]TDE28215.1 hypothetical protein E0I61_11815 [Flavobacterium ranwuense]TDE49075.1 hypothetical protein E0H99_16200 [Flavobacterium sp. GT3P67]
MDENITAEMALVEKSASLMTKISAVNETVASQSSVGGLQGINLGVSGEFVILSKTGITNVYKSAVIGA